MANTLDRDIEPNEVVVLDKKYFKPEYKALKFRVVICQGGFGMDKDTMGKALFVKFLSDGEETRMEGYMVSPKETERYQKKHGKFVETK